MDRLTDDVPASATTAPGLLRELDETAAWLDQRAEVMTDAVGQRTMAAATKQMLREEAARWRARAMLVRMAADRARGM